jgi:hypothetical protein
MQDAPTALAAAIAEALRPIVHAHFNLAQPNREGADAKANALIEKIAQTVARDVNKAAYSKPAPLPPPRDSYRLSDILDI